MDHSEDEQNTRDADVTDWSLSKSTSLSLSDLSSGDNSSSDGDALQSGKHTKRKKTKEKVKLIPPDEKLKKCQSRLRSFLSQNKNENAFSELLKLVPLTRLVFGDNHWKYADSMSQLARGYLELKKFGIQAVKSGEKARTLILSCDPPSDGEKIAYVTCIVETYLYLGKALIFVGGRHKDAENSLLKAWQVLMGSKKVSKTVMVPSETAGDTDDDLKRDIKMALADLYIVMKQIDKAVTSLRYLEKVVKEKHSEKDKFLIRIYSKLAKAEKARKKSEINYEKVVEHSLSAHEISMSCHALSSEEVADTAFALGKAYASINSEETQRTAETYFTEALSAYRNSSQDETKIVKVQDALYKVWMRSGKEEDAIKALKNSIPEKTERFGACSAQVANTYKLIGGVYLSKGDLGNSHKYLSKCLTIETELYGSQHRKTTSTRSTIDLVQQNPGFSKSKQSNLSSRPKFSSTIKVGKK